MQSAPSLSSSMVPRSAPASAASVAEVWPSGATSSEHAEKETTRPAIEQAKTGKGLLTTGGHRFVATEQDTAQIAEPPRARAWPSHAIFAVFDAR